jgi:hypothetical protein
VNISEFQHQVYEIALSSAICDIPSVRRISPTSINLRIYLTVDGYIDVFYNQESDRVAYALIQENQRIYGVDNTGGWHVHPFADPAAHLPLVSALFFGDFVKEIENFYKQ